MLLGFTGFFIAVHNRSMGTPAVLGALRRHDTQHAIKEISTSASFVFCIRRADEFRFVFGCWTEFRPVSTFSFHSPSWRLNA